MENYDLLTSLLPLLAKYESEKSETKTPGLEAFSVWLQEQMSLNRVYKDKRLPETNQNTHANRGEDAPVTLGKLVYYLYRYARFYTKKALKNNPLNSLDEFTFMVTLLNMPGLTKTELIHKMVYDKTTGMELIKRLINLGFISESDNPNDKRSKIISVSEMGKGVLFSSFEELGIVSQIIPGNLTNDELTTLIHLLDKLDHHHLNIWDHHKDSDLGTILTAGKDK